ncbi:MAG: Gfo/Idh/MocA family oxidoreductase [Anaerolineaceae bacterium]|nr:MAG: Gfo/Idh/MocA family oxidoreductase [Anaerolineaceae bacterium]
MNDRIRWGILSTANINRLLIPQMHHSARSEVQAVASRNLSTATAYAAEWEIPTAYGSYEALLNDSKIDVVYIPLPNTLHAEWAVAAANAGKHVLCEKPIVQTLGDFERAEQAARENNICLVEAFANLHHPQHYVALSLIESGRIGELQTINGWFYFHLSPEKVNNIRLNAELGGGSLWDLGVYSNALSIFYAGGKAPQSVWGTRFLGESGVDVTFAGQMLFDNRITAQISCGFKNPPREGLQLVGDAGILEILSPHNTTGEHETEFRLTDNVGTQETIVNSPKNSYVAEIEAMEACVLDEAEPLLPLSLCREFLRTVLALHESANTNSLIQLRSTEQLYGDRQ